MLWLDVGSSSVGFVHLLPQTYFEMFLEARAIHAFLLRCEGLTYQQIGDRMENMYSSRWKKLTLERNEAMVLVQMGAERINRAMRRTIFYWVTNESDPYNDGFDPIT